MTIKRLKCLKRWYKDDDFQFYWNITQFTVLKYFPDAILMSQVEDNKICSTLQYCPQKYKREWFSFLNVQCESYQISKVLLGIFWSWSWWCSERDACYQTKHDKTCIDSHIRNISQHHSLSQHQSPATGHCKWVENILSRTHSSSQAFVMFTPRVENIFIDSHV